MRCLSYFCAVKIIFFLIINNYLWGDTLRLMKINTSAMDEGQVSPVGERNYKYGNEPKMNPYIMDWGWRYQCELHGFYNYIYIDVCLSFICLLSTHPPALSILMIRKQ